MLKFIHGATKLKQEKEIINFELTGISTILCTPFIFPGRPDGIIAISVAVVAGAVVIITTVTAAVCYKYKVYNSTRRRRRRKVRRYVL